MAKVYFEKDFIEVDDAALAEFSKRFKEISAGGGLVSDGQGRYLLIYRHNIWDLPKGKLEEGEAIEDCAVREVEEETGIRGIERGKLLCITHHTYRLNGEPCIKHTFWYEMTCTQAGELVPQTEEDISRAEWVATEDLPSKLVSTYPSILEVFNHAGLL